MSKLIFIAEHPPKRADITDPVLAPYHEDSQGFCLLALTPFGNRKTYIESCSRYTIYPHWIDARKWNTVFAREVAQTLRYSGFLDDSYVVLLSGRVARAFQIGEKPKMQLMKDVSEKFYIAHMTSPQQIRKALARHERDDARNFLKKVVSLTDML